MLPHRCGSADWLDFRMQRWSYLRVFPPFLLSFPLFSDESPSAFRFFLFYTLSISDISSCPRLTPRKERGVVLSPEFDPALQDNIIKPRGGNQPS